MTAELRRFAATLPVLLFLACTDDPTDPNLVPPGTTDEPALVASLGPDHPDLRDILSVSWEPRIIHHERQEPAKLRVTTAGRVERLGVQLGRTLGGNPRWLHFERVGTDTIDFAGDRVGVGIWEAAVPRAAIFAYWEPWDSHAHIGWLIPGTSAAYGTPMVLSASIRTAAMPDAPLQLLSSRAQMSANVFNVVIDDANAATPPSAAAATRVFYSHLPDNYDFVAVVHERDRPLNRNFTFVGNDAAGLGVETVSHAAEYGSAGRLKGAIAYPIDSYFTPAAHSMLHEIGHLWMNFLAIPSLAEAIPHWPTSSMAYGIMGSNVGGNAGAVFPFRIEDLGNGRFRANAAPRATHYNDLELYMMGLLPADSVGPHYVFLEGAQPIADGTILHGAVDTITVSDIVAQYGARVPGYPQAQKEFRLAIILLSEGELADANTMAFFNHLAMQAASNEVVRYSEGLTSGFAQPFNLATGGRATLTTSLLP